MPKRHNPVHGPQIAKGRTVHAVSALGRERPTRETSEKSIAPTTVTNRSAEPRQGKPALTWWDECYSERTFAAWRPFWPSWTSNSTSCPSVRVR